MTAARRILKNFFSLISAEMIAQCLGLIITVYLARILGAGNFGKVAFAQGIVVYFMLISNLGLPTLGARAIARNRSEIKNYVNNILTLRLILAGISFCFLFLFVSVISKPADIKQIIILYGLSLFPIALLPEWIFQGTERMEYIAISQVLNKVLYVLLIFLLIKSSKQLLLIPYLWVAGFIIACGFLIYIFIKQFTIIEVSFDFPFWKDSLKQALPMGTVLILSTMHLNFSTIMLGFIQGCEVVGWYNAAYKIILFISGFGSLYTIVIFPIVSKYYKDSPDKVEFLLSRSIKLMVTIGLPLGVGGTILGKPIMSLIYGSLYGNGVIAFQILIWSAVIVVISTLYRYSLIACDRQNTSLKGVAIGAAANIGLNAMLIPRFSLIGASIATVIAELVAFIYMYLNFQRITEVRCKQYFLKPLLSSIVMGVVLYHRLNWNILSLVTLGILIYFTSIFLLKGITNEELVALRMTVIQNPGKGQEEGETNNSGSIPRAGK